MIWDIFGGLDMDNSIIWKGQKFFSIAKETQELLKKLIFFQNLQMTSKMLLDIVGVISTSKLSILKTVESRVDKAIHK